LPLPDTLGGASVTFVFYTNPASLIQVAAPLFYSSPTQINFQVPWEAAVTPPIAAFVSTAGMGPAQIIPVKPIAPAIFTLNSSGSGQGIVTISATGQLAVAGTPVSRGQFITIYCTGLGPVTNPPPTGAIAGSSPLSTTPLPTVTIGGFSTLAQFSGLVPGLVGLYQVNAQVPSGVAPGSAVQLSFILEGSSSNTVTIAVQ
jgi:uncharacterized protein (TIGR03437 family)